MAIPLDPGASPLGRVKSLLPNPCLLESGQLPLVDLSGLAVREGRRPRPIYTAHKWFARRLGSVFRALLVGATSGPGGDFWGSYYGEADLRGIVVLDPFVGGGTSIIEALRLGATTHAVDVDPVAGAVCRFEANASKIPDLSEALRELQCTVGEKIRHYHLTTGAEAGRVILHHFWVQVVDCHGCGESFDAHPNFVLAEDGKYRWVICSCCGSLHRRHSRHERFLCRICGTRTVIRVGNVTRGRALCPHCGERRPLIELGRRLRKPPKWRLFALEVLDAPDSGRPVPMKNRRFVKANEDDTALYEEAAAELRRSLSGGAAVLPPTARISEGRTDSRLHDYGYTDWTDVFNARQLLHLSLLAESIGGYRDSVRECLSIAFSDHLTTNCMLTAYANGWRRLTPVFSVRAFRHVQRPVELNPWCDGTGRGTFPNAVRKVMRAGRFAREPKELSVGGGFLRVAAREPAEPPRLACGTATDLGFLRDGTVDLVLTDPPYFDNIAYSELSEFFVPWLALLKVLAESPKGTHVSVEGLLAKRGDDDSAEGYTQGLTSAFAEIQRVLKENGLLVFSFRHSTVEAWQALAEAMKHSGLTVAALTPAPGEAGVGPHVQAGTGLWDAVFVMRKDEERHARSHLSLGRRGIVAVKERAASWSDLLKDAPLAFSTTDKLALYRAGLVAHALGGDLNHKGDTISLSSALAASETSFGQAHAADH